MGNGDDERTVGGKWETRKEESETDSRRNGKTWYA